MSLRHRTVACVADLAIVFVAALLMSCQIRSTAQQSQRVEHGVFWMKDPANVGPSLSNLRNGNYTLSDVEIVAYHKVQAAVPLLEEAFKRATVVPEKEKIAEALVRLNDRDDTYWNYLEHSVLAVLSDDIPDPFQYDSNGMIVRMGSDSITRWAAEHGRPSDAAEQETMRAAGLVSMVARTSDTRAVPLLRRALQARNPLVRMAASEGLVRAGDKASIGPIVQACESSPAEIQGDIAQNLIFFDDAQAQAEFDKRVPPDKAKVYREMHAKGQHPWD